MIFGRLLFSAVFFIYLFFSFGNCASKLQAVASHSGFASVVYDF